MPQPVAKRQIVSLPGSIHPEYKLQDKRPSVQQPQSSVTFRRSLMKLFQTRPVSFKNRVIGYQSISTHVD